jgi:hypothetical protein
MIAAQYHHEQVFPHSCLAACATMARLRTSKIVRGDAAAHEERLARQLGVVIEAYAKELSGSLIKADFDAPGSVVRLREDLRMGQWWHIAIMGSIEIGNYHRRLGLQAASRHGPISPPLGPPHAILLIGAEDDEFLIFDPWLPAQPQPLVMSLEEFSGAWTGMFLPVRVG